MFAHLFNFKNILISGFLNYFLRKIKYNKIISEDIKEDDTGINIINISLDYSIFQSLFPDYTIIDGYFEFENSHINLNLSLKELYNIQSLILGILTKQLKIKKLMQKMK